MTQLQYDIRPSGGTEDVTAARPPSRQGKKTIVAHVDPPVAWQLRKLALDGQTTVQALVEEAIRDLFVKYHQG